MAASVLGKRTRSSPRSAAQKEANAQQPNVRTTRRSQFVIFDTSEKENPFFTPKKQNSAPKAAELKEDKEDARPVKRTRSTTTTPAKHGISESRVALSPAKINAHFKESKSTVSTDAKKQTATPSTPRRRDALANKVAVTPRHRVLVAGKPLTPRTPRTPTTPKSTAPTVYNDARQLFTRGSQPGRLIGREEERKELREFVSKRAELKTSGCLYISGPPGTGKSALVNEVGQELEADGDVKRAYINCMSIKSAGDLYLKLLEEIGEDEEVFEGAEKDTLQEILFRRDTSYVFTLDEVDYLLELDLELLYNVFEWSMQPKSSLVLLGIANALDFTDRFLPRLKSRGLKPRLLPFMPYTAPQIASVISSKLKDLMPSVTTGPADFVPFVHPTAITFLAKKVAAQTGDLRKAFDICRRVIDVIEGEARDKLAKAAAAAAEDLPSTTASPSKTPLIENINLSSPPNRSPAKPLHSLSTMTPETAPRATIAHMARVTAAVFSNGTNQRLKTLNLQQKAVLCALAALEKSLREKAAAAVADAATPSRHTTAVAPTVKHIYSAYAALCKHDNVLAPLTSTEFADVLGSLETLSLVTPVEASGKSASTTSGGSFSFAAPGTPSRRGRGGRGGGGFSAATVVEERRVAGCVAPKELKELLATGGPGAGVLTRLLEGEGLL
ncbi:P-loop containing nucleoside triphosphate hydrolase protein [Phyllosticta capitalensis]|uniref:P-loop containing nucleoside triphosphate hydrolase protein n=1 Tax=Phyllosticta capitalensis TaxID=121624 RepID=UPI00312F3B67